ncbi:hypothetical protein BSKO_12010 [Bryopsis sp. KO-2023]|nr:hypothetical protein BSKO_12010 [Bryopsis sp. KO-2023]
MEQDARFDGLAAVLNKVLEKDANAVVVRLVVGGSTVDGDLMVARHHDENLRFTPHDVSVLYLATPRDMLGGELVVWPGVTAEKVLRKKPAVVWPVKNVLVKFRGDSEHKVRGFASVFGEKRISLVIEQYCIPKKKYQLTVEYCVNETCF